MTGLVQRYDHKTSEQMYVLRKCSAFTKKLLHVFLEPGGSVTCKLLVSVSSGSNSTHDGNKYSPSFTFNELDGKLLTILSVVVLVGAFFIRVVIAVFNPSVASLFLPVPSMFLPTWTKLLVTESSSLPVWSVGILAAFGTFGGST